jgi:glycerophosphoryl diester phosphodiesterase
VADFKHGDERWPGLSTQVADFAEAHGPSRVAVLSIRHDFAARVAAAAPGVLALFTYRTPLGTDAELRALHSLPQGVGLGVSLRALSAGMLVVAREDGRAVYAFTPNTTAELTVALTVGADAVITDRPDLALDLRATVDVQRADARQPSRRSRPGGERDGSG